jgi:hypothetical protein
MSEPAKGVALDVLARLHQTTIYGIKPFVEAPDHVKALVEAPDDVRENMPSPYLDGDADLLWRGRYPYAAALGIEVARQLHDDSGVPLAEGLRISSYTGAVRGFFGHSGADDFWIAIVAARNDWGDGPRGTWPVTGFGPQEFWSTMHFAGTFDQVIAAIKDWMTGDASEYGASPARIFMANVSTADRRLRKRAAALGIQIAGNDFA